MISQDVVTIKDVTKVYELGTTRVEALRGVNFSVKKGEFLSITGPSGSGKSTILNLLGCLDVPSDGEYILDGNAVSKLSDDQLADIRRNLIGFVFQSFYLIPRVTILENIELPLFYAGFEKKKRRERAEEAAHRVGLGHRLGHRPLELSGGERQRVAIARALINRPAILLADEPTGNLDSKTGAQILSLLKEVWSEGGTLILVTHDPSVAQQAQRNLRFRDGLIEDDVILKNNV